MGRTYRKDDKNSDRYHKANKRRDERRQSEMGKNRIVQTDDVIKKRKK